MKKLLILLLISTGFACSSIDILDEPMDIDEPELHSGSVYFACDFGPYPFSLDSLLTNYSQQGGQIDSLTLDYISTNDSTSIRCTYDENISLAAEIWDFKITRINNGNTFGIEWQNNSFNTNPIDANIDGSIYSEQTYPFYNGMEIELNENKRLRLLFFNIYIGGCFHDLMVWELEEE
jgi:hypothetical protein